MATKTFLELSKEVQDVINNSISLTTRVNTPSSSSVLSSLPPGSTTPPVDNSKYIDYVQRLLLGDIKNAVNTQTNVLQSAIDNVRFNILSSQLQSTQTITNTTNSISQWIKSSVNTTENSIKQYIASDSDNLRRLIDTAKNASLSSNDKLDKTISSLKEALNKNDANLEKASSLLADKLKQALSENTDNLIQGFGTGNEALVNLLRDAFFPDIENFPQYLVERLEEIITIIENIGKGNYKELEELKLDLFGNYSSSNIASFLWLVVSFVPLLKDIMNLANADIYVKLKELANFESRPTLIDENSLITAYRRNIIDYGELKTELARLGFSEERINLLIQNTINVPTYNDFAEYYRRGLISKEAFEKILYELGFRGSDSELLEELAWFQPTPNDVIRFVVRDVFNTQIAERNKLFEGWDNPTYLEYAKKAGIREQDAKYFWGAHWQIPSPTQAYEMLFRDLITLDDLRNILKSADYAPAYIDSLIGIAYRNPTRVDLRNMYFEGVIDENEVLRQLKNYGYNERYANFIAAFYRKLKIKRDTGSSKTKEISVSLITNAWKKGVINRLEAKSRLEAIGFKPNDAELILLEAQSQLEETTSEDYTKEIRSRLKSLAERAYRERTISRQEALEIMGRAGISKVESQALLTLVDEEYNIDRRSEIINVTRQAYLNYEIDENELKTYMLKGGFNLEEYEKHIKEIKPLRDFRHKDLALADVKKAFQLGIISIDEVLQQLLSLSYSDRDIQILMRLYFRQGDEE